MSANFLADSGDGEVPYAPMAVAHAASVSPPGQDPVEALSHGLLGVAGLCLNEQGRGVASPRFDPRRRRRALARYGMRCRELVCWSQQRAAGLLMRIWLTESPPLSEPCSARRRASRVILKT